MKNGVLSSVISEMAVRGIRLTTRSRAKHQMESNGRWNLWRFYTTGKDARQWSNYNAYDTRSLQTI